MATPFHSPEIVIARRRNAVRRAAAMCFDTDLVLGVELRALCAATHSMLLVRGSAFLVGGAATPGDVRDYVWFHSPRFKAEDTAMKARVLADWWRTVFRMGDGKWWHTTNRLASGYAKAIQIIKEKTEEAFADTPLPTDEDRDSPPLCASLEAQVIHAFCKAYPLWSSETVRWMPLRKLYQHLRCIRSDNGAQDSDREETALMVAHLKAQNAKLAAERAAKAS